VRNLLAAMIAIDASRAVMSEAVAWNQAFYLKEQTHRHRARQNPNMLAAPKAGSGSTSTAAEPPGGARA